MTTRQFTTSTLVGGVAVALALASALVFAVDDGAASYTGCLNLNGGTIVSVAPGDTPLSRCSSHQIQVRLGGGDITSITAGTGLEGGTTNGDATLSVQPSYRLPQGCSFGAVVKWKGDADGRWTCGADADTDTFAFAAVDIAGEGGVPNSMQTIRKLFLPEGTYAIFAKVTIGYTEVDSDVRDTACQLMAESDVDFGRTSDFEGDSFGAGVISLMLVHEFTVGGLVEFACADGGDDSGLDHNDASWSDLRITAIRLGSFLNVPLMQ
jgi:hypothetical protein